MGIMVRPRQLLVRHRADQPRSRRTRHVARVVGSLTIDHAVMRDGSTSSRCAALRASASRLSGQRRHRTAKRLIAVLAKAEASHDGAVARASPHDARRLRHFVDPPRARLRLRRARRPGRPRGDLCVRRRRRRVPGSIPAAGMDLPMALRERGISSAARRRKRGAAAVLASQAARPHGAQPHRGLADVRSTRRPRAAPPTGIWCTWASSRWAARALSSVEETAVEERARKTYHCAGIYSDRCTPMAIAASRISCASRARFAAIQLGHAGRKASCGPPWTRLRAVDRGRCRGWHAAVARVSPSPIPCASRRAGSASN